MARIEVKNHRRNHIIEELCLDHIAPNEVPIHLKDVVTRLGTGAYPLTDITIKIDEDFTCDGPDGNRRASVR